MDLGATPLANALEVRDQAPGHDYPLFLKQCSACGHVQLPVVVDPKLLFPESYPYASATGEAMREHLRRMAEDLTFDMDEGALAVEIGSNDGYLLSHLRDRVRAVGVDPARALASAATAHGQLTIPEFFDTRVAKAVRNACGPADLIVANNVFAHADDLHEIVEGVKVLLAPEGRFVFEVGWLADVVQTNNFPAVYHEHLSIHSIVPLSNLFARHGLSLNRVEKVNTQGGSIRCTVAREQRIDNSLRELLNEEIVYLGANHSELGHWQARVDEAATDMKARLLSLKSRGHSIAAYGCSAKSTTLLHVAGIGRETIDFICDDNPLKVGKFSPGKHLPVVPGAWLEEKQPDYCVSLSGNFSGAFKAAHPLYKGEWIEPDLGGA